MIFRSRCSFAIAAFAAIGFGSNCFAASEDDPSCKPLLDATAKMEQTDHHDFMTERTGDTTTEAESIQVGDVSYIKVNGTWRESRMSPKDSAAQRKENIHDAKVFNCQYERDETINGEASAVYKTHQESDEVKADAEIWISKGRGLVLKEVVTHPDDKMAITIRVDYANVQKPAGLK